MVPIKYAITPPYPLSIVGMCLLRPVRIAMVVNDGVRGAYYTRDKDSFEKRTKQTQCKLSSHSLLTVNM